jgi:hypothetical protein
MSFTAQGLQSVAKSHLEHRCWVETRTLALRLGDTTVGITPRSAPCAVSTFRFSRPWRTRRIVADFGTACATCRTKWSGLARPTVAASLVDGGFECYGLLTTSSAWEATISCDGLLCSFDVHVGLESLQGTLIEPDQTTAGSIQISDQRNDQRDSDGEKNQRQPKARCQR